MAGQNPLAFVAKLFGGSSFAPGVVDVAGNLAVSGGGNLGTFNLTVAAVIKATPGRLAKIVIQNAGTTGGAFVFNDAATTGAAGIGNQIFSLAYNAPANTVGAVFAVDWPCANGIVLSAVPTGGTPIVSVSYS